jgi:hypothetical protein
VRRIFLSLVATVLASIVAVAAEGASSAAPAVVLLGVCLCVLLGLLSLIHELFADEHPHAPPLVDDDSRSRNSPAPQVSWQPGQH